MPSQLTREKSRMPIRTASGKKMPLGLYLLSGSPHRSCFDQRGRWVKAVSLSPLPLSALQHVSRLARYITAFTVHG